MIKNFTKPKFAISSVVLQNIDSPTIRKCKEYGVDMFELSYGRSFDGIYEIPHAIKQKWVEFIDVCEKEDLPIWSAHLPFGDPYDFASMDDEVREKSLEIQLDLMAFLKANTDVKTIVVHPSGEPVYPENRFKQMQLSKKTLKILADEAESMGAQIAVECLPRTCLSNTIDEIAKIVSSDQRLRICFDTNHLLTDKNEDFAIAFGDKIITTHISDYHRIDEEHIMPYEGVNNWKKILNLLFKSGYNGPLLFETTHRKNYSLEEVRDCFERLCSELM